MKEWYRSRVFGVWAICIHGVEFSLLSLDKCRVCFSMLSGDRMPSGSWTTLLVRCLKLLGMY